MSLLMKNWHRPEDGTRIRITPVAPVCPESSNGRRETQQGTKPMNQPMILKVEELEERIAPSGHPGQQGYEGQPGNLGNGQQGYEGQPGNQGNGLQGYEGLPGNQGGGNHHP